MLAPALRGPMPYSQCYEDITRSCKACGRTLVTNEIILSSRLLRTVQHCIACDGRWTLSCYDLKERCDVSETFPTNEPSWSLHWACEVGCQRTCHAIRI